MQTEKNRAPQTVIIGGGFTGLAAAYELAHAGIQVTVLEADNTVGGLAAPFAIDDHQIERFYHYWYTNDQAILDLVDEIGATEQLLVRPSKTGMFYANSFYRLSKPVDILRFTPLSIVNRIRLGLLVFKAQGVKDWRELESLTAEEWLTKMAGAEVYRVVWEPLLRGKFGEYADRISATWMWNKLKLRSSSRRGKGAEELVYFRGGFTALAENLVESIRHAGGTVLTGHQVDALHVEGRKVKSVQSGNEIFDTDAVIATPALPIISNLLKPHLDSAYINQLEEIKYLANVCLVLQLDRALSDLFWINVSDPDFPYVGIIEHTNLDESAHYGNRHIVYLSKYLLPEADLYQWSAQRVFEYSIPHIQRMFPEFRKEFVLGFDVWRARYAQPIVKPHYSKIIPEFTTPIDNMFISTMAQIHPEDRGTNYAVRDGRNTAKLVRKYLHTSDKTASAIIVNHG